MAAFPFWRLVGAGAAVLVGIGAAMSAGSPAMAAFAAALFGLVAGSLIWAPGHSARTIEEPLEPTGPPPLPDTHSIIDSIDDPMLMVHERRVLYANRAAKTVLGEHIEGVDVRLAIRHPAAAERLTDRAGEDPGDRVTRIEVSGLGERDRRWLMTIIRLDNGARLVRLADRSEAHASEQMRIDFVANASHELRTPLATLIGFAETLQDDSTAEDVKTRHRFLKIMSDEARRMQQLIEDLISLSRIEAERFSPPRDAVPLLPLVEEVQIACAQLSEQKESAVRIEHDGIDPVVPGDRAQLLQMMRNLVVNALKYGRQGEDVIVRFDRANAEMIRMSVIDRGDGVGAEHLPRLTERFYRVDPSRSRSMGGTGLGLAIVKHIVGRHRGRLDIRSKPGEGTRVAVYLPALSLKSHEDVTEATRIENRDVASPS